MLLFLPVAVGLSVAAGLVLLRILLARLRGLERLAVRVAAGDLDARVDDPRGDEIGRLADALDAMAERLAQARDHLEASDRQRRQLLADISHELGTPLTSIRGYAETLLDTEVPDADGRWRADLSRILTEANRLDALIGELFDLTRLEAGAPLETERLDWTSLCRHVVSRLEPRFADAGLALSFHGQTEAWVDADGRRLEQLLENLLTNALRYVPTGGTVEVSLRAGSPHELRVADDGPGIDPADLGQVFDRFYRADPARTTGGTGLGLAIVKEIASRHGGSVRAEACTPKGVAFVVGLPAAGS
jgi:signal transduction histidine kinase